MARLPNPGGDDGTWGNILNDFLTTSLNSDGSLKSSAASSAVPDATSSTKGLIQLGGDLSGTAAAPTVPGLTAKADDTNVVHKTGNETVGGTKTFSVAPVVPSNSFPESAVTNLTTDLAATEKTANKGVANGYAGLNASGLVPGTQIGSVVDSRTAAAFAAANPVLVAGAVGFESDTGILKVGDGSTAWSSLAPVNRNTDLAYASLSVARGPFVAIADVTGLSINTISVPYATKIHVFLGLVYNDLAGGSTTSTTIGAQASIDLGGTARAVDRHYHSIGQGGTTGGRAMNLWCDVAANTAAVAKVRMVRTGAASGNAQLYADANTLSFIRQVPA